MRNAEGVVFHSGNEEGECVGGKQEGADWAIAAVVSVTFNRADYLQRHLDSLLGVHENDPANRSASCLIDCTVTWKKLIGS